MNTKRDAFHAIADPTRREIINLLSGQKLNVNSISKNFNVSRQAISLHIKILEECDLIAIEQKGRERICEAKLQNLGEVYQWTGQFKTFWTVKLLNLKNALEEENKN